MELLFVQTKEKPINDFDLRLNPRLHYKQIESKKQLNYSSSQSNEQSNRTNKPHTNKVGQSTALSRTENKTLYSQSV